MTSNSPQPITYLSLYRKYGGRIMRAHPLEMQAAARAAGTAPLSELSAAYHAWASEQIAGSLSRGKKPSVCFNKEGLCEEDKCTCWE